MTRVRALAALAAWVALAPAIALGAPAGLRDAEFGVVARGAVGLERNVEMFQWDRGPDGYVRAWSGTPVDSGGFDEAHANPGEFPLAARRWLPGKVTLDGHPVAPAAIDALATWQPLRPDFSALPGNMSATFQPEGDGLGTAENPVDPQVGDLRVRWRELRMPPTREPLVLRDGTWELRDPASAAAAGEAGRGRGSWAWPVLGMFAGALFLGVLLLVRRRRG